MFKGKFALWLKYFENTWMPMKDKETSQQGYSLLDWNVFDAEIRTNDLAEMQNFLMSSAVGVHPDLWDFLTHLQDLSTQCAIRYNQLEDSHTSNQRHADEIKKDFKLQLLWNLIRDADFNQIDIETLLKDASTIMKKNWHYIITAELQDEEKKDDQ